MFTQEHVKGPARRRINHRQLSQALYEHMLALRSMGYNSQAHNCPDTMLAVIRVAEEAIREAEAGGVEKKEVR